MLYYVILHLPSLYQHSLNHLPSRIHRKNFFTSTSTSTSTALRTLTTLNNTTTPPSITNNLLLYNHHTLYHITISYTHKHLTNHLKYPISHLNYGAHQPAIKRVTPNPSNPSRLYIPHLFLFPNYTHSLSNLHSISIISYLNMSAPTYVHLPSH